MSILDKIRSRIDKVNIAEDLSETELHDIGRTVCFGYDIDEDSRLEWLNLTKEGLKIARQVTEVKNYPWPKAANIKYPLIATAAIQFASRAYPQIVQGHDVVKATIIGQATLNKELRAKRVGMHMSYQLLEEMTEWEGDTDQLLTSLPVVGMYFRKTYYDAVLKRNRSCGISPENLVVNQNIKDLTTARRITEKFWLYKNDVLEREHAGIFLKDSSLCMRTDESDDPELFLEQHTWIDLDDDGYAEPYIVTVHEQTQRVCRIVARYDEKGIQLTTKGTLKRIEPVEYYTDYGFLPDPAGNYYKLGFSHLLGPINETINTTINQLLDAGHIANCQSGFLGAGVNLKGGALRIKPNEWIPLDIPGGILKDNIVPLPVREPSMVLFQLLGLLTDAGMKLAAVSETMTGEMPGQNTPATTVLAMIEQGLKVFTSIYKRVFRSLKSEYKKLYRLNRLYMDETEYIRVLDDQMAVFQTDYDMDDLDIVPVADPMISSEAQRLARAQALLNTLQFNPTKGGQIAILKYYYEAIGVPDLEDFLPTQEVQGFVNAEPPPNPDLIKVQGDIIDKKAKAEIEMRKINIEQVKAEAEIELIYAQVGELKTRAIRHVADAEAKEAGTQIHAYEAMASAQVPANKEQVQSKLERNQDGGINQAGVSGMEAKPDNQESLGAGSGDASALPEPISEGGDIEARVAGTDGNADYASIGKDLRSEFDSGDGLG